ncbi:MULTISPECIES: DUF669 domain-containing protein [unclassified Oceanobacillus]|uniref:DUF669 domain-containing protein n=1 Tax=unclassified Oceanobacillus TaxID=2630292 RepID=UPI001BE50765|nr:MULTISPECIES: DUF669 domain-containing protein [unclassified Oceanobacillus]MBT2600905.1 DUF669 domain-containing protein [Oceanobacillus sp. ISL-74]MBT2653434.1 DUF669 domain-containing protein [Oceanobacillus sp. ISL-73]
MSGFNLDFNNTFEGFQKIDDGVYEVVIESAAEDATQGGAEFTNFTMVIRNDLDQPFKNQKIWERVFKAKATGTYNMLMFNTIGKAAGLEPGKTYNTFDELLNDYRGKPLQVFVQNETSEYNGKTYENLNVKKWSPTKFPNVQHQFKQKDKQSNNNDPFKGNGEPINIQDDDLPF